MSDERDATGADAERRHRRGLKFRQRDDHAVELFREALAKLDDPARVARILLELGRFYNPYIDAPIVDPLARRAVLEALERGDPDTARRLVEARLTAYTGPGGAAS
ncbi:MAG: hypothetical protein HYU41_17365 [Candidatus Rokubacteria bacterium]|nr:hypothetical protein [Candidatus Rokubacteria bacterium]